jgi:Cu(I)/Ag(I) efflux system membrane fusion protein
MILKHFNYSSIKAKLLLYGMKAVKLIIWPQPKRINPVISIYSPVTGVVDGTDSMLAFKPMQNTTTTTTT